MWIPIDSHTTIHVEIYTPYLRVNFLHLPYLGTIKTKLVLVYPNYKKTQPSLHQLENTYNFQLLKSRIKHI